MASSGNPEDQKQILSRRMAKMFPFDQLYDKNTKHVGEVRKNAYHPLTNPKGIINLSVAFSYICDDLLAAKFAAPDLYAGNTDSKVWHVTTANGNLELREAFAAFYTRQFKPELPILAEDLTVLNGATSSIDYLAHCIADPGDVILIPTPSYAYLQRNVRLRAEVDFWPVDLFREDEAVPFQFTPEKVEAAIKDATNAGKNVRGIIIVNPNNPCGDVYSSQLIISILEVCKSHSIHAIMDENSALTVFEEGVCFESCVSYAKIPDPQRTHVIWSLSKDFSFDGSRIAVVYTRSQEVTTSLVNLSYFFSSPTLQQFVCRRLIEDQRWCDEIYFPTLRQRLKSARDLVKRRLTSAGVKVRPAASGFVVMVYFGDILREKTFEEETAIFKCILEAGVLVTPCHIMHCSQPGWFRICFAFPEPLLQTAMDRIEAAIETHQTSKPSSPTTAEEDGS